MPTYRPFDKPPMKDTKYPHQIIFSELPVIVNPTLNLGIEFFRDPGYITFRPKLQMHFVI
jgi:hypothetical protein